MECQYCNKILATIGSLARHQQTAKYCLDLQNKLTFKMSPTKGWKDAAPKRGKEREELKQKCGPKCFLLPEKNKFPICSHTCTPDCRGIISAKIRARQYKYENVATLAQKLQDKLCVSRKKVKLTEPLMMNCNCR